jgi:hypothetical protein
MEDTELSLDAEPGMSLSASQSHPRAGTVPGVGTPTETVPRATIRGILPPTDPGPSPDQALPPPDDDDPDKPRGFWGSLFKKRK